MKGGLTPVGNPLDKVVNNVLKGYIHYIYYLWELPSPINTATRAPHPPTQKKFATWVVEAWGKLLEELCAKACTACGYKTKNELASGQMTEISAYVEEQVPRLVQDEFIDDEYINLLYLKFIGPDPQFLEEDDEYDE